MFDYLVVGAGFAGCVVAERLASQYGQRVLIIDKRDHIGGNCYDCYNEAGILIHRYGPHTFHTNNRKVFEYLLLFTEWRYYQHRVRAYVDGKFLPIPINLDTVNQLYGLNLSSRELAEYFERVREPAPQVKTAEDAVVSQVGRDLFEKFFKGLTLKHWGMEASQLDASVTRRIPVRTSRDDRYFSDRYQGVPKHGYTALFTRMLRQPQISVLLNTDYRTILPEIKFKRIVFTGPIDEYFDYRYGPLPYRSVHFEYETLPTAGLPEGTYQPTGTVTYPNDYDFTRVAEFKHFTGQTHPLTTIVRQYPRDSGEPYYPIPCEESKALYQKYAALAAKEKNVWFIGRLANYRYYNMDQVVEKALELVEKELAL
ncbi:MAG: UDP-galactopyranose mutase [Firmicutes bacterium]|nr:UDP-galactopyranose mutase [Bacillota bacterium]